MQRLWGVATTVEYVVYNTASGQLVDELVSLHTITIRRNGSDATATGTKTNLGNNRYSLALSATDMQTGDILIRGSSSTSGVELIFSPSCIQTVRLPNVAPGTDGGLLIGELTFDGYTAVDGDGNKLVIVGGALQETTTGIADDLAVVDGVVDGIKAKTDLITSDTPMTVARDYLIGETITIHQGTSRLAANGKALRLTDAGGTKLPPATTAVNLNVASVKYSDESFTVSGVVEANGDDLVGVWDIEAADIALLAHTGQADYYVTDPTGNILYGVGRADVARGPR